MKVSGLGTVILTDSPVSDAEFFVRHLGFGEVAKLDWFVSLVHPDLPGLFLDLLHVAHPSAADAQRGRLADAIMIALLVDDAAAEATRLEASGIALIKPLTDEPWGQRRFQLAGPAGTVVEIVQRIAPDPDWLAANMP
ncbi:MAG: VOC family protein [Novosphingobium sp.]